MTTFLSTASITLQQKTRASLPDRRDAASHHVPITRGLANHEDRHNRSGWARGHLSVAAAADLPRREPPPVAAALVKGAQGALLGRPVRVERAPGRLPQGRRRGPAAAHPPLRRRAADLWLPPHHRAGEPGAGRRRACRAPTASGCTGSCSVTPAASGAPYRPARGAHPRRQGDGHALEPALVLRWSGVHLLERRDHPHGLHHRCLRPRDHRLGRRLRRRHQRLRSFAT